MRPRGCNGDWRSYRSRNLRGYGLVSPCQGKVCRWSLFPSDVAARLSEARYKVADIGKVVKYLIVSGSAGMSEL